MVTWIKLLPQQRIWVLLQTQYKELHCESRLENGREHTEENHKVHNTRARPIRPMTHAVLLCIILCRTEATASNPPILPFSDEFCQLFWRNLAMLHVVVEHVKAIVFFTLGFRGRQRNKCKYPLSYCTKSMFSKISTVTVCMHSRWVCSCFWSIIFIFAIFETNEKQVYRETGQLCQCFCNHADGV